MRKLTGIAKYYLRKWLDERVNYIMLPPLVDHRRYFG